MFTHQQSFAVNMNFDRGTNWDGLGVGTSGGMTWGSRGIATGASSSGYSVVSSFQQHDQQQHSLNNNKVSLYTRYYHEWKAIAESPASTSSQKEWATYYADLASRAAHHFYQNPNTTQPPPHDLPPAPPGSAASDPVADHSQQQSNQNVVQKPKDTLSGVDQNSFQVYVDRCLQQCRTPQDKDEVILATKTVLQKAIREGHLHKKDWSREPLIVLSDNKIGVTSLPSAVTQAVNVNAPTPGNGVLHTSDSPSVRKAIKKKPSTSKKNEKTLFPIKRSYLESTTAVNHSYYGPAATSFSLSSTGSVKKAKLNKGAETFNISSATLDRRAKRFADSFQQNSFVCFEETNPSAVVVGTCQIFEKEYLRLTSAPKPELVRPQPILEKHFSNLKSEYGDLKRRRDYLWFCSQLKAIRQDCTVQHLKNEFCVLVYEFHAKVALENGDMNEFNQCQTQLKYLYPLVNGLALQNRAEFLGYRILYAVDLNLHSSNAAIDLKDILGAENTEEPCVKHALDVLSAAQGGDYHSFFSRLYPSPYGYQDYLLERMTPIFRKRALELMCCAYRPTLEVDFVCDALQLADKEWLGKMGCVFDTVASSSGKEDLEVIKTKESDIKEPPSAEKSSKLM